MPFRPVGAVALEFLAVALGLHRPAPLHSQAAPPGATAFVDVSVIAMTDSTVRGHQTVVIERGVITALGDRASVKPPAGALVVDGRGKFLMPGLADAHVHIMEEADLDQFLAWGVTTVRELTGSPATLQWQQRIARGERLGPRIVTSGPLFAGPDVPWRTKVVPRDPAAARAEVRRQHEAGYDFIKIYDGLTVELYTAIADEAARLGMPLTGHIPEQVHLARVLAARQNLEHTDKLVFDMWGHSFDTTRIDSVARAIRTAGVFVTPTIASMELTARIGAGGFDSLLERPEAMRAGPATVSFWCKVSAQHSGGHGAGRRGPDGVNPWTDFQLKVIAGERRAGVPLVAGSDSPNAALAAGSALLEELRALTRAGLTSYEALRAATVTAARALGDTTAGVIAPGRRADLVLLTANPLDDVQALERNEGVMAGGRWLPRAELDRRAPVRAAAPACR
jgi:imidazolonepropionase-like amidohydrolase